LKQYGLVSFIHCIAFSFEKLPCLRPSRVVYIRAHQVGRRWNSRGDKELSPVSKPNSTRVFDRFYGALRRVHFKILTFVVVCGVFTVTVDITKMIGSRGAPHDWFTELYRYKYHHSVPPCEGDTHRSPLPPNDSCRRLLVVNIESSCTSGTFAHVLFVCLIF